MRGWFAVSRLGARLAVAVVAAAVGSAAIAGCGPSGHDRTNEQTAKATVPNAALCEMLDLTLSDLRKFHLTFADLAVLTSSKDHGVGAAPAFAYMVRPGASGRFDLALHFIAKRVEVESTPDHGRLPVASAAVVSNAKALDRLIANGGCP